MKKWLLVGLVATLLLSLSIVSTCAYLYWKHFYQPSTSYNIDEIFAMEKASTVVDRNNKVIAKFYIQDRIPIPLDKIPKNMINAVIATEDQRFWTHSGVDPRGIARAVLENAWSKKITQGGSTLTQQLARNAYELKGRNYKRKLLEIALAHRIEKNVPKEKILEAYLNRVYFGSGFYGIESAAQGYFGLPAEKLNLAQCALLASVLKSPNKLSPKRNLSAARQSRNVVLGQMEKLGLVSRSDALSSSREEIELASQAKSGTGSYLVEMVRQQVVDKVGFERTMSGGLTIHASLDWGLQKKMEASAEKELSKLEYLNRSSLAETLTDYEKNRGEGKQPSYLQVASVVLENSTGAILSLIGGRDFLHSEYNRATQMKRPPALAFSPFQILAALRSGIFAGSVFLDWPLDNKFVGVGGAEGILGEWGVETEANAYQGSLTIREAFSWGKNSALARLGFSTGIDAIAKTASLLGMESRQYPSTNWILGMMPVSPLKLALAYTVFPTGGSPPTSPYVISKIVDSSGSVMFEHKPSKRAVMPPTVVYQVHSMMESGMIAGPASRARAGGLINPVAVGRSGTSYDFQDLWFAGYDSNVTSVVWIGLDKPSRIFYGAFGSVCSSPLWITAMNWSMENRKPSPISPPAGLTKVLVCPRSGVRATKECELSSDKELLREEYDLASSGHETKCTAHSGTLRKVTRALGESQWPRASLSVDVSKIRPVGVKSGNVTGFDPYDSESYLLQRDYSSAPALPLESPPTEDSVKEKR